MSNNKKLDKEATIRNIREKAGDNITDNDDFNELMKNEEDILDSAMLWDAEVVYK
jgi:hypothetical protein